MGMMMTATKETTLASSFVVILTVIATMTRKDDVMVFCSPDGAWSRQMVPRAVKRVIVQFAFGPRCVLCDERPGSLCRIGDAYHTFVKSGLVVRVPVAVLCEI